MKVNFLSILVCSLLLMVGVNGCSKEKFDPDDYAVSVFSGEYGKGLWKLAVTVNGEQLDNYGYVRFDSKMMTEGDFKFVDVIPGESFKEFKNVLLEDTDKGVSFKIEYTQSGKKVIVNGIMTLGKMAVDIRI